MQASSQLDDVDALFDQVAQERDSAPMPASEPHAVAAASSAAAPTTAHHTAAVAAAAASGASAVTHLATGASGATSDSELLERIGRLTRNLHESLQELGYDKAVNRAADALPDARDRLNYIASLTGQAADRTLNTIELAKPLQEAMGETAAYLEQRWAKALDGAPMPDALRELATSTREFMAEIPGHTRQTGDYLLEIMMAQDFHDLTGQVIKKVTSLASDVEEQLVGMLRASAGPVAPITQIETDMNGPVIDPTIRTDVVTGQAQVDDLLTSLGF